MDYEEFKEKLIKQMDACLSGNGSGTFEEWLSDLEDLVNKMEEEEGGTMRGMGDKVKNKSSTDFLNECVRVQSERAKQYDSEGGERSMDKTIKAFNTITGNSISEAEGWLFMQILKDVRQWQRKDYHEDSAIDCVSYASLKAEALAKEK